MSNSAVCPCGLWWDLFSLYLIIQMMCTSPASLRMKKWGKKCSLWIRQCIWACIFLQVDVDIGSSAVANGVLGLVFGVVTTLVVDMAFLIQVGASFLIFFKEKVALTVFVSLKTANAVQSCKCTLSTNREVFSCWCVCLLAVNMILLVPFQANTYEELPEQVIGAARLSNVEPSTAVVPDLENNSDGNKDNSSNDATSSEDDSSKKTNWFDLSLKISKDQLIRPLFEDFDESRRLSSSFFLLLTSVLCTYLRGLAPDCSLVHLLWRLQLSPEFHMISCILLHYSPLLPYPCTCCYQTWCR